MKPIKFITKILDLPVPGLKTVLNRRLPEEVRKSIIRDLQDYNNLQRKAVGLDSAAPEVVFNIRVPSIREQIANTLGKRRSSGTKLISAASTDGINITFFAEGLLHPNTFKNPRLHPKQLFVHEGRHNLQEQTFAPIRPLYDAQGKIPDMWRQPAPEFEDAWERHWWAVQRSSENKSLLPISEKLANMAPSAWAKNLTELDADITTLRHLHGHPLTPFHALPLETRRAISLELSPRFGKYSDIEEIAEMLSKEGYKKGGIIW